MSENFAEYLAKQQKEIVSFRKALTAESDRGCALFAAAYLDHSLSDLLYVSLVPNKKIENDLFENTAPLATFSSRIKMAYYLGLISLPCRRDLDIIRGIRNDFAHKLDADSFSIQSIRDQCRALSFSCHEKSQEPRDHFISTVLGLLGKIHAATLTTIPHKEKSSDAPSEEDKIAYREKRLEISKELDRRVQAAVHDGRFTSVEEAMGEVASLLLRGLGQRPSVESSGDPSDSSPDPILGCMREDAELMDEIVADAYRHRSEDEWREIDP